MIFLTVGTQLPFDRLVSAVDEWATAARRTDIVAQIGPSRLKPQSLHAYPFLPPSDFEVFSREASLFIAHAGMGSILGALQLTKPIIIMPRLAQFGEHRNDHQLATAKRFAERPGVHVALNTDELKHLLNRAHELEAGDRIHSHGAKPLIEALQTFISAG